VWEKVELRLTKILRVNAGTRDTTSQVITCRPWR
jgi:hypothetical protein